jgi:hypothetical protein
MKIRRGTLPDVVFTTGLYLLRRVVRKKVERFAKRGNDAYEALWDRPDHTSRSARKDDSRTFSDVSFLLLGVGVGLGIAVLTAPARGADTHGNMAK